LPPPPPPVPPRDKHPEFVSHKPPTFASSPDPLHAVDWLKSVEKMLNIAQCSDREKVLYASSHLTGPAADWWDTYTAAHDVVDTITWARFTTQFRNYHIPAGLMKVKKKEFLSLKHGGMSVNEYRDKFIQLLRYAPDEVVDDERKQEHFIERLNEHKHVQLGDMKRKAITQGQGSSSVRPRYVPPQGTPARTGGGQRPAQFAPQGTPHTRPAAPTGTPTRFAGQSAGTTYYKCGQVWHYANLCAQRIASTPIQNKQQTPGSCKGFSIARVNQVIADATADGADNVIGMFYINSIPAAILFDSGATHSFISARYAYTNELPLQNMQKPLVVITPKGSVEANCDGTSQVIRPTYSCPCPTDIRHPVGAPELLDKFGIFPYLTRNVSPVLQTLQNIGDIEMRKRFT
jgi:hypothetical protein